MIPDYQSLMLPVLKFTDDGRVYRSIEIIDGLANQLELSEEERKELLPSGQQPIFDNRIGWAKTHLKKAGLVKSEKRGTVQITERGKTILKKKPEKINIKFLDQFPEFVAFRNSGKKAKQSEKEKATQEIETEEQTPGGLLEYAYQKIEDDLAQELLATIKEGTPTFFENLVIDLLLNMGYGGSRIDAGRAIGKSNDGGVDGIIKEDKLGLDVIYVQAKKWENTLPVKEVRDFAGALLGKKAKKGIFITTSSFPSSAINFVNNIEPKIILIDGQRLASLMIGVSVHKTFQVKRIDSDYFEF